MAAYIYIYMPWPCAASLGICTFWCRVAIEMQLLCSTGAAPVLPSGSDQLNRLVLGTDCQRTQRTLVHSGATPSLFPISNQNH